MTDFDDLAFIELANKRSPLDEFVSKREAAFGIHRDSETRSPRLRREEKEEATKTPVCGDKLASNIANLAGSPVAMQTSSSLSYVAPECVPKLCCGQARDRLQVKDDWDKAQACPADWLQDFVGEALLGLGTSAETISQSNLQQERPETKLKDGSTYSGHWLGHAQHGHGILSKVDGSSYEGEFHRGKAHGQGRLLAANGNVYDGQWVQDRAHGFGRYIHEDGCTYSGQWIDDEKSGEGIERWSNGSKYDGHFLHGRKHGDGAYTAPGGKAMYKGQFLEDMMDGEGFYNFENGRKYRGEWSRGIIHGSGKMDFADGSQYVGKFVENERHGEGSFTWSDGREYMGQWCMGRQDGVGTVTEADGKMRRSVWKDGKEIKKGPGAWAGMVEPPLRQ